MESTEALLITVNWAGARYRYVVQDVPNELMLCKSESRNELEAFGDNQTPMLNQPLRIVRALLIESDDGWREFADPKYMVVPKSLLVHGTRITTDEDHEDDPLPDGWRLV